MAENILDPMKSRQAKYFLQSESLRSGYERLAVNLVESRGCGGDGSVSCSLQRVGIMLWV
jgi:hypothetical protein